MSIKGEPAGLDNAVGLISAYYAKWVDDPIWKDDPAIRAYFAWARKYYDGNQEDGIAVYGYQVAQVLEYVLRRRGDDLTRENVMRVATSMENVEFPICFLACAQTPTRLTFIQSSNFR